MQLADFRDIHAGRPIIVCGLGESICGYRPFSHDILIGVNDIEMWMRPPDYLVVMNGRNEFTETRWRFIRQSAAKAIFTQLELWPDDPAIVKFKLGKKRGTDLSSDDSLPYTSNTPYVGICLAAFMGASRIGLIGVDFISHPNLSGNVKRIDKEYAALGSALSEKGIEVYNLSAISRLNAFRKMSVEEFAK